MNAKRIFACASWLGLLIAINAQARCVLFQDTFDGAEATRTGHYCPALNDTGIDWCGGESSVRYDCPLAGLPDQDGEHGRDALAREGLLMKVGSGAAGFDFSKLDVSGQVLPASATQWSCVRDNVTGLVWEVKVDDPAHRQHNNHSYTWYQPDQNINGGEPGEPGDVESCGDSLNGQPCNTLSYQNAINGDALCGFDDWRVPVVSELLGIVHNGQYYPALDVDFFRAPYTPEPPPPWPRKLSPPPPPPLRFWSSTVEARDSSSAWQVGFSDGMPSTSPKSSPFRLRLVRGTIIGREAQ